MSSHATPDRDAFARVLDAYHQPIVGFFAAGGLRQLVGLRYPSGASNRSEALCFGQIAALSAVTT